MLATVASTVYAFTDKYPNAWIYIQGSTEVRTRLYRMGITNNLHEIRKDFNLYGLKEDKWVEFRLNTEYQAFLIQRKK